MSTITAHGPETYNITREGNRISISKPSNGMRGGGGEVYGIDISDDKIEMRPGRAAGHEAKRWDITFNRTNNQIEVNEPRVPGMRCGRGDGFTIQMPGALSYRDFEKHGLVVASNLLGSCGFVGAALLFPESSYPGIH